MSNDGTPDPDRGKTAIQYDRRRFLRYALAMAGGGLLTACGAATSRLTPGATKAPAQPTSPSASTQAPTAPGASPSATTAAGPVGTAAVPTVQPTTGIPMEMPGSATGTAVPTAMQTPAASTPTTPPKEAKFIQTFRSRPDLQPPRITVTTKARCVAPGLVFIGPKRGPDEKGAGQNGVMILDNDGQVVWFKPVPSGEKATDVRVQRYKGRPVLTYWQGTSAMGHGQGDGVILDTSYREIARVKGSGGLYPDLHEFLISPQDTALVTVYKQIRRDLSAVGGPKSGIDFDGIIREIDIATGKVLFEWHSVEHVGLEESYEKPEKGRLFDYFHINSIDVDSDNNLIVSARNTWTIYKLDRKTGEIKWRLGGKKSDFRMGEGTQTAWQHDARVHPGGLLTIFDNGSNPQVHKQSRGVVLQLDTGKMTATLVREYTHPKPLVVNNQGNIQMLPNGDLFIGWGAQSYCSEFSRDGGLVLDVQYPPGEQSYRAYRFEWTGTPAEMPVLAVERGPRGEAEVYASWNGSTETASWQVLAGGSPDELKPAGRAARSGFETKVSVSSEGPYFAVQARDESGKVLATSKPAQLGS